MGVTLRSRRSAMRALIAEAADRRWVVVAGFGIVALANLLLAYPAMFFGHMAWDDEGYFLISLDSFLREGALYDTVYTQYGPFYFELLGGLVSVLGLDVTHDVGRFLTLATWIVTALIGGVVAFRLTRNLLVGLGAQLALALLLQQLTFEPLHPGGMLCLGLVLLVLVATGPGDARWAARWSVAGALVAAMVLVKINVGLLAGMSVAFAIVVMWRRFEDARLIRGGAELLFVCTPLVVMSGQLQSGWTQLYGLHVALSCLALVVALRALGVGTGGRLGGLLWMVAGGLLTALAVVGGALATGTSAAGLVEGVLLGPLRHPDAFTLPLTLPTFVGAWDLAALAGCVLIVRRARREGPESHSWWVALSLLRIAVGLTIWVAVAIGEPGFAFGFAPPLAWLAVVPGPSGFDLRAALARAVLVAAAVLQVVHAYPVGCWDCSQIEFSVLLLVIVGAVCIGDGLHALPRLLAERRAGGRVRLAMAVCVVAGAVVLGAFAVAGEARWKDYRAGVNLALPGAERVRLPGYQVEPYRELSRAIRRECTTFVTHPGMNSFYLWARTRPPNGQNATAWMFLFDRERQGRVARSARAAGRLCVLRNQDVIDFWARGGTPRSGPLLDLVRNHRGQVIYSGGGYVLSRYRG